MKRNAMTNLIAALILLGAASTASGAESANKAANKAKEGRDCMFSSQLSSWTVLDDQQLVVWGSGQHDAYLIKLFAPEHELRFAETLAVIDHDHNGLICGDGGDRLTVPGSITMSLPAIISSMRRVDDAELLALSEKYKVKLLSKKKIEALKEHDKQIHSD